MPFKSISAELHCSRANSCNSNRILKQRWFDATARKTVLGYEHIVHADFHCVSTAAADTPAHGVTGGRKLLANMHTVSATTEHVNNERY